MSDTFVVVGGDAAGMSAASKARRDDPSLDVVVLERGSWVSYGACGLPAFVKGDIASVAELSVVDPRELVDERGIDLRRGHDVVDVDPGAGTVTVDVLERPTDRTEADGETDWTVGERYDLAYDDLLLATGGRATLPPVSGTDLPGAFTLRSIEAGQAIRRALHPAVADPEGAGPHRRPSAREIRAFVGRHDPETAAIVGANKIGLELAEAFHARGLDVHVFESEGRVLPGFGPAGETVAERMLERGVTLHLDTEVTGLSGGDRVRAVETVDGRVPVDLVAMDVGVEPNAELADAAGVTRGPTGAVATDAHGETNVERVYAAGDCAEKRHLLTDVPVHWPYALAANRAGRAVGRTVAGRPTRIPPIVGTLVLRAFDLEVARTGLLAPAAEAEGYDPHEVTLTSISRAHYVPGWSRLGVHGVAGRDSQRLLGLVLVGEEGAAHRINAAATALTAGLSVREVGDLDFGYSPPFGPVWDPVLTAAKVLGDELE